MIASPQNEKHNAVWHEVKSAGAVPRRVTALFIAMLEGLTLGVRACCPEGWLSCVHPIVAQGPITHRWFTAFAPRFTPRRVLPVFDCGRTHGVRRHCSFHSRSARCCRYGTRASCRLHINSSDSVKQMNMETPSEQNLSNRRVATGQHFRTKTRPFLHGANQPARLGVNRKDRNGQGLFKRVNHLVKSYQRRRAWAVIEDPHRQQGF